MNLRDSRFEFEGNPRLVLVLEAVGEEGGGREREGWGGGGDRHDRRDRRDRHDGQETRLKPFVSISFRRLSKWNSLNLTGSAALGLSRYQLSAVRLKTRSHLSLLWLTWTSLILARRTLLCVHQAPRARINMKSSSVQASSAGRVQSTARDGKINKQTLGGNLAHQTAKDRKPC